MHDYVRKVHHALQNRKEKIIMVYKNMLNDEDIELVKELAEIYDKTVILASLQDIIFNKDNNIYIVD